MTQKTQIFSYLVKNPNSKPAKVAKALGFPQPSVRRIFHTLRNENILTKPIKEKTAKIKQNIESKLFEEKIKLEKVIEFEEEIEEEFEEIEEELEEEIGDKKKYILNTVLYCSSKPKTIRAITYSDTDFDNSELLELMENMSFEIMDMTNNDCSDIAYDSGLDITVVNSMPFEYPEIEVSGLSKISKIKFKNIQGNSFDWTDKI